MARRTLRTRLCDMLGIDYPIICAGMGPTLIGETAGAPAELVVAVSEAGGMGVLGGSGFTVERLRTPSGRLKQRRRSLLEWISSYPKSLTWGEDWARKGSKSCL